MRIFLEPPAAMLTTVLVALALAATLRDVWLATCNVEPPLQHCRRHGLAGRSHACRFMLVRQGHACKLAYFDNKLFVACSS